MRGSPLRRGTEKETTMYFFWERYLTVNQILMLGMAATFAMTFILLKHPFPFLPSDHGRAFAVNGTLSRGKLRGVGLTFVLCFLVGSLLFLPVDREYVIYAILLFSMMMSGYLDDASDKPWNEYVKGLLDLIISVMAAATFLNFNDTTVWIGPLELLIPKALYFVLAVILLWGAVNVTNCSDGVDGLCASVSSVTLLGFALLFSETLGLYAMAGFLFIAVLFAYLYFNASPSSMLMGDAGSRALGFFIGIVAMKSQDPFAYLLLAGVTIADGGIGLVKVFLKRYLKICILTKTRTPLHDHARKNLGWSDAQVVSRYIILQSLLVVLAYWFLK